MTTPKQERFAREFAVSGNGTSAAVAAGYAPNSAHVQASRLLKIDKVVSVIEAERTQLRERFDLNTDDVLRGLHEIAQDANAPHSSRVQAWRLLGLATGLFDERLRVEHTSHDVSEELKQFTVAELRSLAAAAQQQVVEAEGRMLGEAQMLD